MSHNEFVEWIAFAKVEPIGGLRGDLQAALLATLIANVNRDSKKQKAFTLEQFLLDYWKEQKPLSPSDIAQRFAEFATQHNQQVKNGTNH